MREGIIVDRVQNAKDLYIEADIRTNTYGAKSCITKGIAAGSGKGKDKGYDGGANHHVQVSFSVCECGIMSNVGRRVGVTAGRNRKIAKQAKGIIDCDQATQRFRSSRQGRVLVLPLFIFLWHSAELTACMRLAVTGFLQVAPTDASLGYLHVGTCW